jgi:hypothetical protein
MELPAFCGMGKPASDLTLVRPAGSIAATPVELIHGRRQTFGLARPE